MICIAQTPLNMLHVLSCESRSGNVSGGYSDPWTTNATTFAANMCYDKARALRARSHVALVIQNGDELTVAK